MAKFATTIKAIDPISGQICDFSGPVIEAKTWSAAQKYCDENGLGYCKISGIIEDEPVLSGEDMAEIAPALQ